MFSDDLKYKATYRETENGLQVQRQRKMCTNLLLINDDKCSPGCCHWTSKSTIGFVELHKNLRAKNNEIQIAVNELAWQPFEMEL